MTNKNDHFYIWNVHWRKTLRIDKKVSLNKVSDRVPTKEIKTGSKFCGGKRELDGIGIVLECKMFLKTKIGFL